MDTNLIILILAFFFVSDTIERVSVAIVAFFKTIYNKFKKNHLQNLFTVI